MNNSFNDDYRESYLNALRIISSMDALKFSIFIQEISDNQESQEEYILHEFPNKVFSAIEFETLKDCVNMRKTYLNMPISKPHLTFPIQFIKARKKFYKEMKKYKFVSIDWITNLSEKELI